MKPYKYHPARKQQILDQVSIIDVASDFYTLATTNGRTLQPEEINNYSLISTQEHDSLLLYKKTNSFFRFATGEGGDVFSFLQKMPEINMSFMEAFQYLYAKVDPSIPAKAKNRITKESISPETHPYDQLDKITKRRKYIEKYDEIYRYAEEFNHPEYFGCLNQIESKLENVDDISSDILLEMDKLLHETRRIKHFKELKFDSNNKNVMAYLIQKRCIHKDIVFDLIRKGLLRQQSDEHGVYAVFLSKNQNGEIENLFKRGCTYNNNSKYEDRFNKGNGWLIDDDPSIRKPLIVFEGHIDMLSFMSLQLLNHADLKKYAYLSIGGVAKSGIVLDRLQENKYEQVMIAFDNDDAGIQGAERLKEMLIKKNVSYAVVKSHGNDWNDDLCEIKSKNLMNAKSYAKKAGIENRKNIRTYKKSKEKER